MNNDEQISIDNFLPKKVVNRLARCPKYKSVKVSYLYFIDKFNII